MIEKTITPEEAAILSRVDHTLLGQAATWEEIRKICDEGLAFQTASVCIPPVFVSKAAEYLGGNLPVCTVIGFPNGYSTTKVKVFEAQQAIAEGAREIDMVIHIGALRERDEAAIFQELKAMRTACDGAILKVIIETCLLQEMEKVAMCRLVTEAGADYIKTSTGFSKGGATVADVTLMKANVGANVRVKAAGGISTLEDALALLAAGADRLGTSRMITIIQNHKAEPGTY
jgi:deoxyribose-phosphate aldolase